MESYHESQSRAIGADESQPQIIVAPEKRAIDRLRDDLRRVAPRGERYSHRAAARTIGCSASRIPELMCRLESRGEITRTPYKNTYLIDASPLIDQEEAGVIDQPPPDCDTPHQEAPNTRNSRDRVKTPCMVDHDSKTQEEESARSPLFERLITQPGMSRPLAARIATHPIGTLADFLQDLRLAQSIAAIHSPFFFTVAKWRDGQRVVAPEEHPYEHPARSATASGTRRRSHPNQGARSSNTGTPEEYAAILAEIRTARPITLEELGLPVPGKWRAADGRG